MVRSQVIAAVGDAAKEAAWWPLAPAVFMSQCWRAYATLEIEHRWTEGLELGRVATPRVP
jgi:hypothetical protein